ncbi:hypothetical protein [Nonlabens sp.]|uniref:hypothetical protein n=1 Tax=Nonlabens sp. TaxID=1888209 RepID=UPI0025E5312E|nr:hypothetical protein [Nonlabens sp.]
MMLLKLKYLKKYKSFAPLPLLLVKDKVYVKDLVVMNQEDIHGAQQKALLVLFFYLEYAIDYLIQFVKVKNQHKVFRNFVFESEAYSTEAGFNDQNSRKLGSFIKFYGKKYAYE